MVFSVEILVDGKEVFHVNNKSPPNYFERYKNEKITQIKYMDPIKYDYPKNALMQARLDNEKKPEE